MTLNQLNPSIFLPNVSSCSAHEEVISNQNLREKFPFSVSQIKFLLRHEVHFYNMDQCNLATSRLCGNSNTTDFQIPNHVAQALDWIKAHLINPYYPTNWLYLLVESARMHSVVYLKKSDNEDRKEEDRDNYLHELHLFLEAMAGLSGRRSGSSWDIKVFFSFLEKLCCCSNNSVGENEGHTSHVQESVQKIITAEDVIGLLYRFALSGHVLQNWRTGDDFQEMQTSLNLELISKLGEEPPQPIVNSLCSYGLEESGGERNNNRNIDFLTLNNWIEMKFPQMASILSSFVHQAFFSWQCPQVKSKDENCEDTNEHNGTLTSMFEGQDDDENVFILYAQGQKKLFQFPFLKKFIFAPSSADSLSSISETDTTSMCFNLSMGEGGAIGHFAFGAACMDPKLCGKWHHIYSTEKDGFDFLNLQRAIIGYSGPTILIIRPTQTTKLQSDESNSGSPGLFGFYTNNGWKESKKFYGSSDCFLFRAEPIWNVYRPLSFVQSWGQTLVGDKEVDGIPMTFVGDSQTKYKENYMYFNPSTCSLVGGRGESKHGLILGGTKEQPRFYLKESLTQCIASSGNFQDKTFESGPLLPCLWDKYYNVDVLEVWAVGGEIRDALLAREKQKDRVDTRLKQLQKVDSHQFLNDFQNGLLSAGSNTRMFGHRQDDRVTHNFKNSAEF